MHRPLWQIFLTIFVVGFALQRAAVASVLFLDGSSTALLAGYVFQCLAAGAAALGLWLGRAWAPGAILGVGVAVAATALLGAMLGTHVPVVAVSEVLVAAVSAGTLFVVLRRELGPEGTARGPRSAEDSSKGRLSPGEGSPSRPG